MILRILINKIIILSFIFILSFLIISCKNEITNPVEKKLYTAVLKGTVTLENQTEFSNCLVYIDSLNRGVSSDSSGNYTIFFTDEDSIYSGEFKLIYFLNDYHKDSAQIYLVKGKVKLDTLDVKSEGKIKTKEMKQIVLVEGWTDKIIYTIGDTLDFTARFTNVSDRIVHLRIPSIFNQLGHVGLYNDKYYVFIISPLDPTLIDFDINLSPGNFYEGQVRYLIPDGDNSGKVSRPLIPDKYIVTTSIDIEGRLQTPFQSKFNKFVFEEWYKIVRGASPKLDIIPNKYQFPHIKIIQ